MHLLSLSLAHELIEICVLEMGNHFCAFSFSPLLAFAWSLDLELSLLHAITNPYRLNRVVNL